ncbi:ABC transporter permease [bacterium]|nr:ABC transporter permease [bacterium]
MPARPSSSCHPPVWINWLLKKTLKPQDYNVASGDLLEEYCNLFQNHGKLQANLWLLKEIGHDIPAIPARHLYWRIMMIKNYLKVAFRNLKRQKLYAAINILGLAIGMAGCLLIYLWVQDELSFDRYHTHADSIYRVEREMHFRDTHGIIPVTGGTYGEAYQMDYPEVEDYVRVDDLNITLLDHRQVFREQAIIAADATLLSIFDFPLESGDAEFALDAPLSVVLTAEAAERYLGTRDALGKTLSIQWNNGELTDFNITGILKPVPRNSHFHFEMAISIASFSEQRLNTWLNNFLYTYIKLKETANPADLEAQSHSFVKKHLAGPFAPYLPEDVDPTKICQMRLKPITAIHLNPSKQWEIGNQGSKTSVVIFSAIAVLILLIACINFINLSTAKAGKRALEVGLRKTVGAHRGLLLGQFLSETVLMATISAVIALIAIAVTLPAFNALSAKAIRLSHLLNGGNILIVLAIICVTGILAGLYPAFYLSSFKPAAVLRGETRKGRTRQTFRRSMAVIQFIISITLIVSTLTVYRQMNLVQNQSMGFDKENLIVVNTLQSIDHSRYQPFRNEILTDSRCLSMAYSSNRPGEDSFSDSIYRLVDGEENHVVHQWSIDYHFVNTYGMKIIAGRNLSTAYSTDSSAVILNEAAAIELGSTPEEIIGKTLLRPAQRDNQEFTIVGVVENFNYKTLHMDIEPLAMLSQPQFGGEISIRIAPGDVRKTLEYLESTWMHHFPSEPFNFYFLDEAIMARYTQELRMRDIFLIFSGLSIMVACLGLFGLASYSAQEKTKEIGIRKVLGAGIPHILGNLLKEFTQWVMISNIVAWPLAWYLMNKWLQNFATRISLGLDLFIIAAVISLAIAIMTVLGQALKASLAQPVKSLKYE